MIYKTLRRRLKIEEDEPFKQRKYSCLYSRFAEFLPFIYPPELEIKGTTYTAPSASFLDLYLEFADSGQLSS
jgi:hypothetical protein